MAAYVPVSIFRHIFLWSVGIILLIYIHSKNSQLLIKITKYILVLSLILVAITLFKGRAIKGAQRWISIYGISIQPSELIKTSVIVLSSHYIFKRMYSKFFMIYGVSFILLAKQPDFGSIIMLATIMTIQMFISNMKLKYFMIFILLSLFCATILAIYMPHVKNRIFNFINGSESILGGGYQGFISIQTILSGGIFGKGINKGIVKHYLPDAYSDFIFSVISEELGLIGAIYLIFTFIMIFCIAFKNNKKLYGTYEYVLNISCASILLIQTWINIASALWLIPTKGVTLPFISHGGTSLITSFILLSGIFLSNKMAKMKINLANKIKF